MSNAMPSDRKLLNSDRSTARNPEDAYEDENDKKYANRNFLHFNEEEMRSKWM